MRDYAKTAEMIRVCSLKKRIFCSGCVKDDGDESYHCAIDDAADAIEELLAAVPKWISVEERLPRKYEEVITVDKHGRVQWNYLINEKHLTWSTGYHITHWMQLPEPPKEVE